MQKKYIDTTHSFYTRSSSCSQQSNSHVATLSTLESLLHFLQFCHDDIIAFHSIIEWISLELNFVFSLEQCHITEARIHDEIGYKWTRVSAKMSIFYSKKINSLVLVFCGYSTKLKLIIWQALQRNNKSCCSKGAEEFIISLIELLFLCNFSSSLSIHELQLHFICAQSTQTRQTKRRRLLMNFSWQ